MTGQVQKKSPMKHRVFNDAFHAGHVSVTVSASTQLDQKSYNENALTVLQMDPLLHGNFIVHTKTQIVINTNIDKNIYYLVIHACYSRIWGE